MEVVEIDVFSERKQPPEWLKRIRDLTVPNLISGIPNKAKVISLPMNIIEYDTCFIFKVGMVHVYPINGKFAEDLINFDKKYSTHYAFQIVISTNGTILGMKHKMLKHIDTFHYMWVMAHVSS